VPELVREAAAAGVAELLPQRGIGGELCESGGKSSDIPWRDKKSSLAGDADFPRAIDVVADDRLAGDERLGERSSQSFPQAGMNQDIHRAEQLGNSCRRDEAGKLKVIVQSGGVNLLLQ
jgi:hypothetical protein